VADFLGAWSRGDGAETAALVDVPQRSEAARLLVSSRQQLHAVTISYLRRGPVSTQRRPGADYQATVQVRGLGSATWTGRVPLVRRGGAWLVAFSPAVVHPDLRPGGSFSYTRQRPRRGQVQFPDGQPLSRDADLDDNLRGRVAASSSASEAAKAGPLFVPGDTVGVTGLERVYNDTLGGQPGGSLTILGPDRQTVATLLSVASRGGSDVRTTLDARTQRAGRAAVAGVGQPGALVALDVRTSRVLALVNSPASGFNRAIAGKSPPGSTFKIVTSAAALIAGVPPSTTLDCSPTATINGRSFTNAENESFGPIDWRQAFAKSCNTWFVKLQAKVPLQTLSTTAALFGFSTSPDAAAGILPTRSFGGSYPTPKDRAQAAGQAIGQDLVLASPLQMASVAAAVASGSWRQPAVVPGTTRTISLPAAVTTALRTFMAAVVSPQGTAGKAGLPAGTYGKTGTAETAASVSDPKLTDSWFVGFRGSVAFAVEFDRAGFGADVAAPAAARFLRGLALG